MKIWKIIILCVASSLVTLSVAFNIFFVSIFEIHNADSFKQVLLSKEILEGLTNMGEAEAEPDSDVETNNPTVDNPVDTPIGLQEGQVVYSDNGITITYLNQETSVFGPQLNFYIVNNSEYTLWVSATNVYIDGVQADLSGGGVSDIESGKKAYLEFTIWESDYENFTNDPSEVEFDLVVRDDSTWDELDRVEDLILKLK